MRLDYLGPEGTYTQQAAEEFVRRLRLSGAEMLPLKSIDDVLESLNQGMIDSAVVPLRNNLAGDYTETAEGLQRYDFNNVASIELQIRLALGIHPETDEAAVTEIRSKDTALRECSEYLREHYPNALLVEVESTAAATQAVIQQNQRHVAAVGSETGMRLYGLKLVAGDIGNQKDNFTTFIYLEKR